MEESAADGCSLCTQFLQSGSSDYSYTRLERRQDLQVYEKMFGDAETFPCGVVQVLPSHYKGKYDKKTTHWDLTLSFKHPKEFWNIALLHRPESLLPTVSYDVSMMAAGTLRKLWLCSFMNAHVYIC
jgi:hypothetical protein